MSRRLARVEGVATLGSASSALTVPVGHKYEVVGVSYGSDSSAAVTWYLAYAALSGIWFRDQFELPAGKFGLYQAYNSLVLVENEVLYIIPVSSGSPTVDWVVDYVDVTPA